MSINVGATSGASRGVHAGQERGLSGCSCPAAWLISAGHEYTRTVTEPVCSAAVAVPGVAVIAG